MTAVEENCSDVVLEQKMLHENFLSFHKAHFSALEGTSTTCLSTFMHMHQQANTFTLQYKCFLIFSAVKCICQTACKRWHTPTHCRQRRWWLNGQHPRKRNRLLAAVWFHTNAHCTSCKYTSIILRASEELPFNTYLLAGRHSYTQNMKFM